MKTPYDGQGYENIGWIELFMWIFGHGKTPGFFKWCAIHLPKEEEHHRRTTGHYGLRHYCAAGCRAEE